MEKVYKLLKSAGATNIVLGILILLVGITFGVMNIITGGRLLKNRRNILF